MVRAENQREVSIEVATRDGYNKPPLFDFFMTRYIAAYAAEAFITFLGENFPVSPSGADGLRSLIIAEAALKSVHEGRAVRVAEIS